MTKAQIGILGFLAIIVLVVVLIFVGVIPGLKNSGTIVTPKTQVNFWGLSEDESAWSAVISRYSSINPTVQVNFTGIDLDKYEETLLDALAAGRGPDVLLLRNDWLFKHKNKVLPAPANIINVENVNELFPKVVSNDFVTENEVFSLPISIETLALAYNRDFFDAKQVAVTPDTWDKIKSITPRLREIQGGRITKSAISIGATESTVKNASDILMLLMLQNGAQILNKENLSAFDGSSGLTALKLYTDFSDSRSPYYSIDEGFTNSLQSFARGDMAMIFVYPSDIKKIRNMNSVINMKLVGMPQLNANTSINLARYWGLSVSSQTESYGLAWDFIKFATTDIDSASFFVTSSGKPPALRTLVNAYETHPTLSIFAPQILNADSSPRMEADKIREIFNNMIKSVVVNKMNLADALNLATIQVNQLFKK